MANKEDRMPNKNIGRHNQKSGLITKYNRKHAS